MAQTGPIATFGAITGGSLYTAGTYTAVPLTGGSGSGATADITVSGGAVTAVILHNPSGHQQVDRTGKNYKVNDSVSAAAANIGGTGSGFSVVVATLAAACENCFFGKIIPLDSTSSQLGQRYCSHAAFPNNNVPNNSSSDPWSNNLTTDNYFCGDGADSVTGLSFSQLINQLPQQYATNTISGFFVPAAGFPSYSVSEARYRANMQIVIFPEEIHSGAFILAHGLYVSGTLANSGFNVTSSDGTNFNGNEHFSYLAG